MSWRMERTMFCLDRAPVLKNVQRAKPIILNSDGTTGQTTGQLMPVKQPSTWPVITTKHLGLFYLSASRAPVLKNVRRAKPIILNSDGTTGQTTGQLMPVKRLSTWPIIGLTTGQSALAAGVHCPVVLTTRSTPNSIDDCAGRAH